jgi:hypothetical protein
MAFSSCSRVLQRTATYRVDGVREVSGIFVRLFRDLGSMHLWMVSCNRNIRWKHRISVCVGGDSSLSVELNSY